MIVYPKVCFRLPDQPLYPYHSLKAEKRDILLAQSFRSACNRLIAGPALPWLRVLQQLSHLLHFSKHTFRIIIARQKTEQVLTLSG